MERDEFNALLKASGLKKADLAVLLGQHAAHVSQMGATYPVPRYALSILAAWRMLDDGQRRAWLASAGAGIVE